MVNDGAHTHVCFRSTESVVTVRVCGVCKWSLVTSRDTDMHVANCAALTWAHVSSRRCVWRKQRTRDRRKYVCYKRKECAGSCIRVLWLFRLPIQISLSHRVSLAVLWKNSLVCDSAQMRFAATRNLWSRLRLVVFFRKWRVGARFVLVPVGGVCQWCLVLQTCVLRMVVVL